MKFAKKLSWAGIVLAILSFLLVMVLSLSEISFEIVQGVGLVSGSIIASMAFIAIIADYLTAREVTDNDDVQDILSHQAILEDLEQLKTKLNKRRQDKQIAARLQDSGTVYPLPGNKQDEQPGNRLTER